MAKRTGLEALVVAHTFVFFGAIEELLGSTTVAHEDSRGGLRQRLIEQLLQICGTFGIEGNFTEPDACAREAPPTALLIYILSVLEGLNVLHTMAGLRQPPFHVPKHVSKQQTRNMERQLNRICKLLGIETAFVDVSKTVSLPQAIDAMLGDIGRAELSDTTLKRRLSKK